MSDRIVEPLFYVGVFCLSVMLAFFGTALSIPFARRFKFLDYPDKIKLHGRPVPYLGGVAIFAAFWIMVYQLVRIISNPDVYRALMSRLPARYLADYGNLEPRLSALFLGGLFILIVGVVDDRFILKPAVKFAGQVAAALFVVHSGFDISAFHSMGWMGTLLSTMWVVTLINSFNFIDSIDGHCAGIAFIASGTLFVIALTVSQPLVGLILVVLCGAILGFIPFNFDRARTFLGDNGSMFLGYTMAVLSLHINYKAIQPAFMTLFVPLFVFGVPIYDLLSVVAVRLYRGMAPWKGDRNHFAHRLVRMGMDGHDAVLFAYIVGTTTGLIAVLSTQITSIRGNMLIVLLYCMILFIIAILEYHSVRHKDRMLAPDKNQGGI